MFLKRSVPQVADHASNGIAGIGITAAKPKKRTGDPLGSPVRNSFCLQVHSVFDEADNLVGIMIDQVQNMQSLRQVRNGQDVPS